MTIGSVRAKAKEELFTEWLTGMVKEHWQHETWMKDNQEIESASIEYRGEGEHIKITFTFVREDL